MSARGEEAMLADTGNPCAKLASFGPNQEPRKSGLIHGVFGDEFFDPVPEDQLAAREGRV